MFDSPNPAIHYQVHGVISDLSDLQLNIAVLPAGFRLKKLENIEDDGEEDNGENVNKQPLLETVTFGTIRAIQRNSNN